MWWTAFNFIKLRNYNNIFYMSPEELKTFFSGFFFPLSLLAKCIAIILIQVLLHLILIMSGINSQSWFLQLHWIAAASLAFKWQSTVIQRNLSLRLIVNKKYFVCDGRTYMQSWKDKSQRTKCTTNLALLCVYALFTYFTKFSSFWTYLFK